MYTVLICGMMILQLQAIKIESGTALASYGLFLRASALLAAAFVTIALPLVIIIGGRPLALLPCLMALPLSLVYSHSLSPSR